MKTPFNPQRRTLFKLCAAMGGSLVIGVNLMNTGCSSGVDYEFVPNAWVKVNSDETVTVVIDRSEMGQGVATSLSMLVAEELEVPLEQVKIEFAPADDAYINPLTGVQSTGGSTSVRAAWTPLREAGAVARQMLISAAAEQWEVAAESCHAEQGAVVHESSGRRLSYGRLAKSAAKMPIPPQVTLKEPSEFRVIGNKPSLAVDAVDKAYGEAVFGVDVVQPDMLVAVVLRCPVFGGQVAAYSDQDTLNVPGVIQVVSISSGIAVIAESLIAAREGRDLLQVTWDEGTNATLSSDVIRQRFIEAVNRDGTVQRDDGDALSALASPSLLIEADYETPYLAHAAMEPMNCTAQVTNGRCEIWVPTQAQSGARQKAATITGLPLENVEVHTTFLGGGFGRRLQQDFVAEAVESAMVTSGAPVQVLWSLEEDLQHDYYRPGNYTRLQAVVDVSGAVSAWFERIAGPSNSLGGVSIPYAIPNVRVETVVEDPGVPTGPWRSVGASQNAFAIECFVDELANLTGTDPVDFRRSLLAQNDRALTVVELAAEKAGWGTAPAAGRARGIAFYASFASWVAEVAEVSVSDTGEIRVHRLVCAIDCGMTVNPDGVAAQVESAVAFALTATLKGEITFSNGRAEQSNFHDYPLLRFSEMPQVEVHIVPSDQPPGGVGEPGVPPLAPAVANAVFAVTGRRVRQLPIRPEVLIA